MAHKWMQKANEEMEKKGTKGSFTRAAHRHHETPAQFQHEVLSHKGKFSSKMVKKAQFRKNVV